MTKKISAKKVGIRNCVGRSTVFMVIGVKNKHFTSETYTKNRRFNIFTLFGFL